MFAACLVSFYLSKFVYIRTYTYVKLFGSSVAYLEMCKHIRNRNAIVCFLTNFIPNQSLDMRAVTTMM